MKLLHIALIAGTRPELIKMAPLYLELKQRLGISPKMVLTGQHRELAREALKIFEIEPDIDMDVMQPNQSLVMLSGRLSLSLANYVTENHPDIILAQGDTTSAMMASIYGFYSHVPVGHVEAGLRTGNFQSPFPEEFNRRVITLAARWHFAPTQTAVNNLAKENVTENVHLVGNTVIDGALMIAKKKTANTQKLQERFPFLSKDEKKAVLVTAHRRENFDGGLQSIASAVKALAAARPDLNFIIPVHPNPMVRPLLTSILKESSNVYLTDPMGYDEILFLIQKSAIILTDSGGIQEEAPAFDVPVMVLRKETERPEGIEAGCSVLVGNDAHYIQQIFSKIMNDPAEYKRMANTPNPYGDGQTSRRIADILLEHV